MQNKTRASHAEKDPPSPVEQVPPSHAEQDPPSPAEQDPPSAVEQDPPSQAEQDPPSPAEQDPPSHAEQDPPSPVEQVPPSHAEQDPPSPVEQVPPSHAEQDPPSHAEKDPPSPVEQVPPSQVEQDPPSPAEQDPPFPVEQDPPSQAEQDPPSPAEQDPPSHAEQDPPSPVEQVPPSHAEQDPPSPAEQDSPSPAEQDPPSHAEQDPPSHAEKDPPSPVEQVPPSPVSPSSDCANGGETVRVTNETLSCTQNDANDKLNNNAQNVRIFEATAAIAKLHEMPCATTKNKSSECGMHDHTITTSTTKEELVLHVPPLHNLTSNVNDTVTSIDLHQNTGTSWDPQKSVDAIDQASPDLLIHSSIDQGTCQQDGYKIVLPHENLPPITAAATPESFEMPGTDMVNKNCEWVMSDSKITTSMTKEELLAPLLTHAPTCINLCQNTNTSWDPQKTTIVPASPDL
ncbi:PREDICTED: proteoglycan 4-like, partial [Amphimedon queenslandica]|uniref:Uncharacterized protein n=2 Tax=Amphimedon queenslandica TaxID=400682 RepID=A0AAN0K3U3_AMPQE